MSTLRAKLFLFNLIPLNRPGLALRPNRLDSNWHMLPAAFRVEKSYMYAEPSTLKLLRVGGCGSKRQQGLLVQVPGVAASVVQTLKSILQVSDDEIVRIVGMSYHSYRRYRASGDDLNPAHADAVLRAGRLIQAARLTFGDDEKVLRWLKAVHPILGAKPIDLLGSDAGAQATLDELFRIRWGDLA
jgi:putative toxin-antitoxin system antitoxin component (TIGR02293 family)